MDDSGHPAPTSVGSGAARTGELAVAPVVTAPVAAAVNADGPYPRASRVLPIVVGIVGAAVVGVGLALAAVLLIHATRTPASPEAGRAELTALAAELAQSAPARHAVVTAVDATRTCSMSPVTAGQITQTAISARRGILADLDRINLSGVPGGDRLRDLVAETMTASISADQAYSQWMGDIASTGTCNTSSTADPAYARAVSLSGTATALKTRLASELNTLSERYEVAPVTPGDL